MLLDMTYELSQLLAKRTLRVVMPEACSFNNEELAKGHSFTTFPARGVVISFGNVRTPSISMYRTKRPIC